MNARTLLREVEGLEARRPSSRSVPEDPVEFARSVGLDPDEWQRRALASDASRQLYNCSRQSGKSSVAACLAVHIALTDPGALVLLLSPGLRQSQELFKKCADFYHAAREPVPTKGRSALRLELASGSRIISLPAAESTVRGYSSVRALIVDEASRVPDDLYRAARPFLAVSAGRLIAPSTPAGKRGWWHTEWTEGEGWERYEVKAAECPRIPPEFLAEERAALPDRVYRQEYMCSFEDVDDSVFTFDVVDRAVSSDVEPLFGGAA
jgi:hypothetical protein